MDGKGQLSLLDPHTRRAITFGSFGPVGPTNCGSLSRDERWIYFTLRSDDADVWLAELK
jgi:hypothetical protein